MLSPRRSDGSKRMSKELVFVLEPDSGRVTIEISQTARSDIRQLENDLGAGINTNCAKPAVASSDRRPTFNPDLESFAAPDNSTLCLYRIYHNSITDGPGRRSVIQVAGCSIRCRGCYVPQTHERENGSRVSITSIVAEILANRARHDGVTILGGEPFDQPGPVAELVSRIKHHGIHLTIYSGYTIEALIARKESSVNYILTHVDLLIDGPFVSTLAGNAGEYRGSANQRFIGNATIG